MHRDRDWEQALDLIEAFVDDEYCHHDHHGTCQSHSSEINGRCGNLTAIDFLDEHRPGWNE